MAFEHLAIGDTVKRSMAGIIMDLTVGDKDDEFVWCGIEGHVPATREQGWKFDLDYGIETDEEAEWGFKYGVVLSWLLLPDGKPAFTPVYEDEA